MSREDDARGQVEVTQVTRGQESEQSAERRLAGVHFNGDLGQGDCDVSGGHECDDADDNVDDDNFTLNKADICNTATDSVSCHVLMNGRDDGDVMTERTVGNDQDTAVMTTSDVSGACSVQASHGQMNTDRCYNTQSDNGGLKLDVIDASRDLDDVASRDCHSDSNRSESRDTDSRRPRDSDLSGCSCVTGEQGSLTKPSQVQHSEVDGESAFLKSHAVLSPPEPDEDITGSTDSDAARSVPSLSGDSQTLSDAAEGQGRDLDLYRQADKDAICPDRSVDAVGQTDVVTTGVDVQVSPSSLENQCTACDQPSVRESCDQAPLRVDDLRQTICGDSRQSVCGDTQRSLLDSEQKVCDSEQSECDSQQCVFIDSQQSADGKPKQSLFGDSQRSIPGGSEQSVCDSQQDICDPLISAEGVEEEDRAASASLSDSDNRHDDDNAIADGQDDSSDSDFQEVKTHHSDLREAHAESEGSEVTSTRHDADSSDESDDFYDAEDQESDVTDSQDSDALLLLRSAVTLNSNASGDSSSDVPRSEKKADGCRAEQGERSGTGAEEEKPSVHPPSTNTSTSSKIHSDTANGNSITDTTSTPVTTSGRRRRTKIAEKPQLSLSLWSIMKNCIGKELSKIPMPVNFNEPLSMLQRLTEELEYSEILDAAALCSDPVQQLAHVAAFTVSAYATTLVRTTKPFNPLLGETFEMDRTDDLGWRSLAEQVSHHPPTLATHAEGRGWALWQEFTMTIRFRGRYVQIIPRGMAHLKFSRCGSHYTWRKVTTTVHNIIVGRLWVDNEGDMDITNHVTGDVCHLKYTPYSYFSKEPHRKVAGVVRDEQGEARWLLRGTWCTSMEAAPVTASDESNPTKPLYDTGPYTQLWTVRPAPPGAEKMYHLSQLAVELNEPEDGVAPTDSRHRPDQRCMEDGKWEEANHLKFLLEEKQRAARRARQADMEAARDRGEEVEEYQPTWFKKTEDPVTGGTLHVYTGHYWECKASGDWGACPDIYL